MTINFNGYINNRPKNSQRQYPYIRKTTVLTTDKVNDGQVIDNLPT